MEPSLDELITASAPLVTPRTPELELQLARLAAEVESATTSTRRRLRGRIAVSSLAVVGLFGLGTGASAAGILPAPAWAPWYDDPAAEHSQTVSSGAVCDVKYGVKSVDDPALPASPAERHAAVTAAQDFVRDFDFSTINVEKTVDRMPPSATVGAETADEVETFAVQYALQERLDAELIRRGLPPTIGVSAMMHCDGGNK